MSADLIFLWFLLFLGASALFGLLDTSYALFLLHCPVVMCLLWP